MKWTVTIMDSGIRGWEGTIEQIENEFVVCKKSVVIRVMFGLIGSLLDPGKENIRFTKQDVLSCEEVENTFSNTLKISLRDGQSITLKANRKTTSAIRQALGR